MKKIIALSLLALTLGANIPSTAKADRFMDKTKAASLATAKWMRRQAWQMLEHKGEALHHNFVAAYAAMKLAIPITGMVGIGVIIKNLISNNPIDLLILIKKLPQLPFLIAQTINCSNLTELVPVICVITLLAELCDKYYPLTENKQKTTAAEEEIKEQENLVEVKQTT